MTVLALMTGALLTPACRATEASHAVAPPPGQAWLTADQMKHSNLVVAPVTEHEVGSTIVTSGRVTFDDLRVSHVFSPVTGRVVRIAAHPGQRVKKGAPLVVIESPDVGSAFADLDKAQADVVAAGHEFNRARELFEAHAAPRKDLETAQDNFDKAKAEMERARQKARMLRAGTASKVSQEFVLRSPIDGEVIARNVNPGVEVQGQYSGGGSAVELFTIGELDRVWVIADAFEIDMAKVNRGAEVTMKVIAYPDKVYRGSVDFISGSLDASTRTAKVRCAMDNPQRELKPEMYATVQIAVPGRRALAVPRSAVLHLGDQTAVFVKTGNAPDGRVVFERRVVTVDEEEEGEYVPVTHGIEAGEQAVTAGAILLSGMV